MMPRLLRNIFILGVCLIFFVSMLVVHRVRYFNYDSTKFSTLTLSRPSSDQLRDSPADKDAFYNWLGRPPQEDKGGQLYQVFVESFESMTSFKEELKDLHESLQEPVHTVAYEDIDLIREIRRMPPSLRVEVLDSAKRHRIPAFLLVNMMIRNNIYKERFSFKEGIHILEKRRGEYPPENFLTHGFLDVWGDYRTASRFLSFTAAMMDGKVRIGAIALRPVWVRQAEGFSHFKLNTKDLSDQRISWLLLDPRYDIEAASAVIRQNIDWVNQAREAALNGRHMDFSFFDKEAIKERNKLIEDPQEARLLPDLRQSDDDWINLAFHERAAWSMQASNQHMPWNRTKTVQLQEYSPAIPFFTLIVKSGVLDDKPGRIIHASVKQLMDLKQDKDPYLRRAAENSE